MDRELALLINDRELIEKFLATYQRPTTRATYRFTSMKLIEWLEAQDIRLIDAAPLDLERFLAMISQGKAASTANGRVHTVRALYSFLEDEGVIATSPARRLALPLVSTELSSVEGALTLSELRRMMRAAHERGGDYPVVLTGLIVVGLKPAEMVSLTVPDFRRGGGVDELDCRGRTVKLPAKYADVIAQHVGGRSRGPLLLNEANQQMTPRNIRDRVDTLALEAGVKRRVLPTHLRASVVMAAVTSGMAISSVAEDLGITTRHVAKFVKTSPSIRDSVPMRMARLIHSNPTHGGLMDHVYRFMNDPDVDLLPPALLCGAALEIHLRALCADLDVRVRNKRPGISDFAGALRAQNHLSARDFKVLERWAEVRNDAAHGHSGRLSRGEVESMVGWVSAFIAPSFP